MWFLIARMDAFDEGTADGSKDLDRGAGLQAGE